MSLDSFKTIMDPHASREDRIAVLASETDIATGIIDNTTDVDKAYFENTGPSEDTGTVYAAVCDLLDMIHGRVTGQVLNLAGLIRTNASGQIGIGGDVATEPTVINCLRGRTWVSGGDLGCGSGLAVDGTTQLSNTYLNTADGEFVRFNYLDLDYVERVIPSREDETLDLFEHDESANLVFHIYGSNNDATSIRLGHGGGVTYERIPMNFQVRSQLHDTIFSLNREGGLVLGPAGLEDYDSNNVLTYLASTYMTLYQNADQDGPDTLQFLTAQPSGSQYLDFRNYGSNPSHYQIQHYWNSPQINYLRFYANSNEVFRISEDYVRVTCPTGRENYFEVYFDSSRYSQLHCKLPPNPNRTIASPESINSGLILSSGRSDFSGRLGFDGWHEWNSLRLFCDDYSGAGPCIPTVALGQPLGTNVAPIDALIVMKDPFGAGVGVDHRALYASHSTKDGLHVGVGQNDNGMLWLWGSSGHFPGIHMGVDRGAGAPIIYGDDEGAIMSLPGDTAPAQVGVDDGDHVIPVHYTLESLGGTGDSDIRTELQLNYGWNFPGAAVLVVNQGSSAGELWIAEGASDSAHQWFVFTQDRAVNMETP